MRNPKLTVFLGFTALLAFFSAARAETYTGKLEGTDAFIAVITSADRVVIYTCDGQNFAQWFRARLVSSPLEVVSTDGEVKLTARISTRLVSGTLFLEDGKVHPFKALRSASPAGLFRSETLLEGANYIGGWVVLPNGEQRGSIMGGGLIRPAGAMRQTPNAPAQSSFEGLGELSPFGVDEVWVSSRVL